MPFVIVTFSYFTSSIQIVIFPLANIGNVTIIVASVDSHLNERGYIVPGMGDAGDRIYNT